MNIRPHRQFDFSAGIQDATSWILQRANELANGANIVFNRKIGAFRRRNGFVLVGDAFATNKTPRGGHTAQFSTGSVRMVACNNAGDTFTIVRAQNATTGVWTTLITDFPADSEIFFFDYLDETYVTGYVRATLAPVTPRNIDKTLNVSTTRNMFAMPPCHYIAEWNGALYACNVTVSAVRYSDRAYESSPPLGAITFVQADQSGLLSSIPVDSVRYIKVGMDLDIYRKGTDTKLYDLTVTAVDKVANTFSFTPTTITFLPAAVTAATDLITLSSTTAFPTGTPIQFTNSGGGLPAPLVAGTVYYAINISGTTIKVATTLANALAGTAIDITTQGTGTHTIYLSYVLLDNDEIWYDGRKNKLTMFWNTDYPTPEQSEFLLMPSGKGSSTAITAVIKSNNRLFLFTRSSRAKFDGQNLIATGGIGCVSMRSLQNLEDDWMIWLDAKGDIYARNDASGQQEKISKAIRELVMRNVTQVDLAASNAGVTESMYKLYVGDIAGEHIRVVYDFDTNTWAIEKLGYKALIQITDESTGYLKPYFYSDNGRLYIDETGNLDDDKVIPMEGELGKDMIGTEQRKEFDGLTIFSNNATGLKIMVSVDDSQFVTVGQITETVQYVPFDQKREHRVPDGVAINTKIVGSVEGDAPEIEGIVTHWNPREDVPNAGRKQR